MPELAWPERHDLHEPDGAGVRHRPAIEATLHVDDRHDQPGWQVQPLRLRNERGRGCRRAPLVLDDPPELRLHRRKPDLLIEFVLEAAVGLERLLQQLAELGILLPIGKRRGAEASRASTAESCAARCMVKVFCELRVADIAVRFVRLLDADAAGAAMLIAAVPIAATCVTGRGCLVLCRVAAAPYHGEKRRYTVDSDHGCPSSAGSTAMQAGTPAATGHFPRLEPLYRNPNDSHECRAGITMPQEDTPESRASPAAASTGCRIC